MKSPYFARWKPFRGLRNSPCQRAPAIALAVGALLWFLPALVLRGATSLEKGFLQPPDSARPWVYWFVMDGNLSREGITADFEAMKRVGLGGVLFMEVDVGIPKGPVKFMSPPWRELFKHANQEAARLGMTITMPASPGWTGSGGPWVKPEQSMQKLVAGETNLSGPQRFEGRLPQPPVIAGFYRDVAVLAFPTPPQVYRIADIQEKALYHRGHFSSEAGVKALIPALARYPALAPEQVIPAGAIIDLTGKLARDGRLAWDVPPGQWTVLRFGHTSTGANTRPAPEPGLGLECDKLDKAALQAHFHEFLGKLMDDLGPLTGRSLVALHIDSWEMGPQNWTAKFREEFQRRRGYDLLRYLPVMTGRVVGNLEVSERFLWDLRQTVLELITENHSGYLAELAHQHGMKLSIEPYDGTPCDDMTYGSRADVPMGEFWRDTFNTWFSCAEATSVAHTWGKRIVQAEAFTSGDGERWLAHPATLKTLGDWAYCEGINRFVFHRYAHQPWLNRWPGMTMGPYGIHYERTQTWWEQSKAWVQYLTRCQFLLQQGLPVADVCFLTPEASPQVFSPPASATRGHPPERLGYNFDACTPEALMTRMTVKGGRLVLPDGMSYRLLVLPETQTMTPNLLRKIKALVEAGATVIGPPPVKSPSLAGYPECDDEVKMLADELWGGAAKGSNGVMEWWSDGKRARNTTAQHLVLSTLQHSNTPTLHPPLEYADFSLISSLLIKMGVPPDFETEGPLRYTHRSAPGAEIYFVANRDHRWVETYCTFRVSGRRPEIWDPRTGEIKQPAIFQEKDGRTSLPVWLAPEDSVFVVFPRPGGPLRPKTRAKAVVAMTRDGQPVLPQPGVSRDEPPVFELLDSPGNKLSLLARRPGRYEIKTAAGKTAAVEVGPIPAPRAIAGPWEVHFQAERGAPEKVAMDQLIDWSKHPDPGVKFFSGTAAYHTTFQVPAELLGRAERLDLDLGNVQVMAQVKLNGKDLGILWKPPFRLEVTEAVKAGANNLEIAVVNLWPNRLIGDQSLPPEKRVAWTTWNPFTRNSPLLESGLLGPVSLQSAKQLPVPTP